jgi:hypothetical protein
MTPFILYCSISWLIGVGVALKAIEEDKLDFAMFIAIVSAPLILPIYLGYLLSKIK